jgi:hypothetical protein
MSALKAAREEISRIERLKSAVGDATRKVGFVPMPGRKGFFPSAATLILREFM